MLWLEEQQTRKKISKIFYRYEKTFPAEERRDEDQFLGLVENPDAFIFTVQNQDETIGYLVVWRLDGFLFLEHFEIFEEFRNQKYGEKILETLREKFGRIILESEPDFLSEIANRRIRFYEKNQFRIVERDYLQPSYGEGKPPINLFLMANFQPTDLQSNIKNIYNIVYSKEFF